MQDMANFKDFLHKESKTKRDASHEGLQAMLELSTRFRVHQVLQSDCLFVYAAYA